MSERSFEALQKDMITKLSNSFEVSRTDILKVEPSLHEWNRQLNKLEHLRDENNLHHYLLTALDLPGKNHFEEATQEALLAPLKQSIQAYLEFLPHDNFTRANEILNIIRGLTFNSHEAITEFVKLRSELSKKLNNHITSKCQKIHSQIVDLLKNLRSQLHNLPPEQSALSKTDLHSKKAHDALALFQNFAPSLPNELETIRVNRYNITLTNEDLLSLKNNSSTLRPNVVDFFGNYLNERSAGGTLFLNHGVAQNLLADSQVNIAEIAQNKNLWETYERICIPYTDSDIKWCLIIIENQGETAWVTDFGHGIPEENKVKTLVANLKRNASQDPKEVQVTRIAYGGEANEVGSPLLWEMYGLALKGDDTEERSRGEKERARFAQLLFQTLLLIGTDSHKILKFDELL